MLNEFSRMPLDADRRKLTDQREEKQTASIARRRGIRQRLEHLEYMREIKAIMGAK